MRLLRIDHNPSRGQLIVFGVIWLVFFGMTGGIVLRNSGSFRVASLLWSVAIAFPATGWIVPAFMRIVYLGMAYVAFPIGFVVSYLVLAVVYYIVLTPIGLVMRLFGYDPMSGQIDENAETYWCPREQDDSLNAYFRQF